MVDELIDICDEDNILLGIQKMKSEAHAKGLWHRSVHIWIYNSHGEILLQLRAKNKDLCPDVWDLSVGGHVGAGEKIEIAVMREAKEEISLDVEWDDVQFSKIKKEHFVYKEMINKELYHVHLLKFDGDIARLHAQDGEVAKMQFFAIDKIEKELKMCPEKYSPHGDYWFEMIDEIKQKLGEYKVSTS